jgi:Spx/MgsR family transcriptional regulator
MKLYGIPNCDTVKKARTFLEKKKVDYEFVDFKKTPPVADDIKRWETAFGELPVNKAGQTFKKHKDAYEKLSPKEKVPFIIANSSMIKRPILEKNGKVLAFGFKEEEYKALLK